MHHGSAERAAKLVAVEGKNHAGTEGVGGLPGVAAMVFEDAAVDLVAAASRDNADLRAGLAVFGRRDSRRHLEFADHVDGNAGCRGADERIVIGCAVYHIVVAIAAVAIYGDRSEIVPAVGALDGSGREQHKLVEVPRIERKVLNLFSNHGAFNRWRVADGRARGRDDEGLALRGGNRELEVAVQHGLQVDLHVIEPVGAEAGRSNGNRVDARRQGIEHVKAIAIAGSRIGYAGLGVDSRNRGAGNHRPAGIVDGSGDPAGRGLRPEWQGEQEE